MKKNNIKLTIKAKDLLEVLSNLSLSKDFCDSAAFTLNVEIENTKNNYKYLSTSEKILDWDFIEEENKDKEVENIIRIPINNYSDALLFVYINWINQRHKKDIKYYNVNDLLNLKINFTEDNLNHIKNFFLNSEFKETVKSSVEYYLNKSINLIKDCHDFNSVLYYVFPLKNKMPYEP